MDLGASSDAIRIEGTDRRDSLIAGQLGIDLNGDLDGDVLLAGIEDITLVGLGGNDLLSARGGNNIGDSITVYTGLHGGNGNDRIMGGRNNAYVAGGPGNDLVAGGPSADPLYAGPDEDIVRGYGGDDGLFGGGGNDVVKGHSGDDTLIGRGGNDRLLGGSGRDTCSQGPGTGVLRACEGEE